MKKILGTMVCLLLATVAFSLDIKTLPTDQPPKFILKDGEFSGFGIDIIRGIERVDSQLHFFYPSKVFTPIARMEKALADGEIDVCIGLLKSTDREAKFNYSLSLAQTYNVFVGLADDHATFTNFEEFKAVNKGNPILAISNSARALRLKQLGFKVDDGPATFSIAMNKLLAGRSRFLFVSDLAAYGYIKDQGLGGKLKVFPPIDAPEDQYLVFSKKAPKALVDSVTAAVVKMKSSGALAAILVPYLGP